MSNPPPDQTAKKFDAVLALRWWASLQRDVETKRPGNPAALSALRRCETPAEVCLSPAFEMLVRSMPNARPDDLAVVAAVLAHVREHDGSKSVAEQMGQIPPGASLPPITPLRFRRILQVAGHNERLTRGARLVRQLKGKTNVIDLASSLYWWDNEQSETQRDWARAYYAALPAELLQKN